MNQITIADLLARGFKPHSDWVVTECSHYPVQLEELDITVWPEYVENMGRPRWFFGSIIPFSYRFVPRTVEQLDAMLAYLRMKVTK